MLKILLSCVVIALLDQALFAQTTNNLAPGAPGRDAQWEDAGKDGMGTSATLESKVWFTLNDGVMTEVYYPTVDVANVRMLQFVVVSPDGKRVDVESEKAGILEPPEQQDIAGDSEADDEETPARTSRLA